MQSSSPTPFGTGDRITFDDTNSNATSITLSGSLEPENVTVSNTSKNFSLGGGGSLTGQMSLAVREAEPSRFPTPTVSAGPVTVNAGKITFGNDAANASALGSGDITLNGRHAGDVLLEHQRRRSPGPGT